MSLSKKQSDKLEAAFQAALQLENNTTETQIKGLDDGVEGVLPLLLDDAINHEVENYEGVVFNQYKIIRKIGSGGMGNVYLAERNDGQFDKKVAIKILSKGYTSQDYKDRFLREKQILAKLNHPNIVTLLDAGETDDGIPWFVLEFVDGNSITEFFIKNTLTTKQTIKLFLKICDALHFAHSKNIIHRDIKPDNILIETSNDNFNPIILDFGIAHISNYQQLTLQGNITGTPGYMSPEQLLGKSIDNRTDIFSFGVVLYQVFAGIKPFKASSAIEIQQKTINSQPKKITNIVQSFPKDLQTIISKCLKKKANNRYQSVLELKHDLENWLNGYPISAKKDNLIEVGLRAIKRNKLISAIILSALAFVVFSFTKYTIDINHQRLLAIESKHESDDLLNFVIKDLNKELTQMGRVDLLESIAIKSLKHLKKYEHNFDTTSDLNHAISYQNIANVLSMQQDNSAAEDAYENSTQILEKMLIENSQLKQKILPLLSLSYLELAATQSTNGQLEKGNSNFIKALNRAKELQLSNSQNAAPILWKVYNAYIWNLMESSKHDKALELLNKQIDLVNQALIKDNKSTLWLNNQQKSFTAFAWYYVDLRKLDKAISYYQKAQNVAEKLFNASPHLIPLMSDLQKIRNQYGYTLLLKAKWEDAINVAEKSIELGKLLFIKAPENKVFYRELSYAYTVAGDAYIKTNQLIKAEKSYLQSLEISEEIVKLSPNSASLVNDLAIDTYNFSKLLSKINKPNDAKLYNEKAENTIKEIAQAPDASIYYIDTYVSILMGLGKVKQANPFLTQLNKTEGWPHESFLIIAKEYNLDVSDYQ